MTATTDVRPITGNGAVPAVPQRSRGMETPVFAITFAASALTTMVSTWFCRRAGKLARLLCPLATLTSVASWMYLFVIRPWHLRWGATDDEVLRPLPGDDIVPNPMVELTRAITIDAPAEMVWPWLVQMGHHRAGWYSYDIIDNAGVPSADRIIPEYQHLEVGDVIPAVPEEGVRLLGRTLVRVEDGFKVWALEPNRLLVLVSHGLGIWQQDRPISSWTFVLEETNAGQTRFIERIRGEMPASLVDLLFFLAGDPGDFIMMRKHMLGIKERAERAARAA